MRDQKPGTWDQVKTMRNVSSGRWIEYRTDEYMNVEL